MPVIGNQNAMVGLVIDLRTIGPVPVTVGRGICGLVGTSTRGPANEAIALGMPSSARSLYYSGDLKEAIETAFNQGCPVIYAVRVLGSGNAKAQIEINDGLTTPQVCGIISASSEGIWGNSVVEKIEAGDYAANDVEVFPGDGTVGPYALSMCDLVESTSNYVKVDGTPKTIVYDVTSLGAGKVYVDKTNGTIQFYEGEGVPATSLISVSIKYNTRKITITDNERKEVYNNVRDLIDLESRLLNSALVRFTPHAGSTHLPEIATGVLTDGDDGDAITTDSWESALQLLGNTISPTTVAITDYEVNSGSYDLVAVLDGFLSWMDDKFTPCLGFVAAKENEGLSNLIDLAAGYNNRHLTIVGNGWDQSAPRQNLAVARAAKEAAVALGESTAEAINSLNGVNDLLVTFNQDEMDALTRSGVDILMKQRGIKPYLAISTATDWQFMRCVDNRTVDWVTTAIEFACRQFYHKRRTVETMMAIKSSICAIMDEQVSLRNVEKYDVQVYPNETDTGRVDIELMMQNIGHIERIRVTMGVGVMSANS